MVVKNNVLSLHVKNLTKTLMMIITTMMKIIIINNKLNNSFLSFCLSPDWSLQFYFLLTFIIQFMTVSSYLLQFSLHLLQFFLSFFSSFSISFPVLKPLVLVLTPLPSIFCPSNCLKRQQKQPAGTTFSFYHNLTGIKNRVNTTPYCWICHQM